MVSLDPQLLTPTLKIIGANIYTRDGVLIAPLFEYLGLVETGEYENDKVLLEILGTDHEM